MYRNLLFEIGKTISSFAWVGTFYERICNETFIVIYFPQCTLRIENRMCVSNKEEAKCKIFQTEIL